MYDKKKKQELDLTEGRTENLVDALQCTGAPHNLINLEQFCKNVLNKIPKSICVMKGNSYPKN